MSDVPEEGRDPRGRGRGPNRWNLLTEVDSASGLSPPTAKLVTQGNASRLVDSCDTRPESGDTAPVEEPPGGSEGGRQAPLAPSGRREASPRGERPYEARSRRADRADLPGGAGRCGEVVPSSGWRDVAAALDAEEGQGHE